MQLEKNNPQSILKRTKWIKIPMYHKLNNRHNEETRIAYKQGEEGEREREIKLVDSDAFHLVIIISTNKMKAKVLPLYIILGDPN
jgi:hypothetical protein